MKQATVNNVKAGSTLIHQDTGNRLYITHIQDMKDVGRVFWFGVKSGDYLLSMNLRDWWLA